MHFVPPGTQETKPFTRKQKSIAIAIIATLGIGAFVAFPPGTDVSEQKQILKDTVEPLFGPPYYIGYIVSAVVMIVLSAFTLLIRY